MLKIRILEEAQVDIDMETWEEIMVERGGVGGGMEAYQQAMTENQIQEDIETLEEMLPIEEAWIERQQITKRTDPDRMSDFTERQGRYYKA